MKIIGYILAFAGLGLAIGPFFGTILFMVVGFTGVFYTLAFVFLILGVLTHRVVREEADK